MKKLLLTFFCLFSLAVGKSNAQCQSMWYYYSNGAQPTVIMFYDSSMGTTGPLTFVWDFGDGSPTSTVQAPTHTYPANGVYYACETITDSLGCTNTMCDSVYAVTPPPVVNSYFDVDSMSLFFCTAPQAATFYYYATASGYTTVDSLKFEILFGDGVDSIFYLSLANTSFQGSVHHAYLNSGTYTAQLTVTGPDLTSSTYTAQTITISATCGPVSGYVYNDVNGNCTFDPGEGLANVPLEIYNANQFTGWTSSDANGLYSFNVPTGNSYDIHVYPTGGFGLHFTTTCPPSGVLTVNSPSSNNNFGVACPADFDLRGYITGWGFRPGFTSYVCVYAYNQNCNTPNGQIEITFPPNTTPQADSTGSYTVSGNTVTYQITSGTYAWSFCIPVDVSPNAQLGDSLCFDMNITPTIGDADSSNNTGTFCFPVRNSWDPNDKYATPVGEGADGLIRPNTDLTYTIRFQNTGNADAINIYILDSLNSNLDQSTVEVIATSHPVTYSLLTGNVMRFNYANINLPDIHTNEPASHGYVTYSVRQKSNVAQLAQITNTAYIYFDFNQPIITNTTLNTVDQFLSVKPVDKKSSIVSIYPNPANQKCNLYFNDNLRKTISVTDVLGKEVFRFITTGTYVLNTEKFATGIYSLHLTDEKNQEESIKLVISH